MICPPDAERISQFHFGYWVNRRVSWKQARRTMGLGSSSNDVEGLESSVVLPIEGWLFSKSETQVSLRYHDAGMWQLGMHSRTSAGSSMNRQGRYGSG